MHKLCWSELLVKNVPAGAPRSSTNMLMAPQTQFKIEEPAISHHSLKLWNSFPKEDFNTKSQNTF